MIVAFIVAMTRGQRVMGKDNALPWQLPDDLKRFRALTENHTIIMGRKTYESIGRPLPRRRNIVLSRNTDLSIPGVEVFASIEEALKTCQKESKVFVIGGSQIFKETFPLAHELYFTFIEDEFDGDVLFPELDLSSFEMTKSETFSQPFRYTFSDYVRI